MAPSHIWLPLQAFVTRQTFGHSPGKVPSKLNFMENFEVGILLLSVGMTTVFVILLIVIYLGKGLTILVNKYAPEEIAAIKQPPTHSSGSNQALSDTTLAAIVAAVGITTEGKGKVVKVDKA